MATFSSVFEHSSLWYSLTDLVLVGTKQPLVFNYSDLRSRMSEPSVQQDLKLSTIDQPLRLLSHFLMGGKEIRRFVNGAQINTDDHPIVEFHGARSIGTDTRPLNLESLRPYLESAENYIDLAGLSPTERDNIDTKLDALERSKQYIVDGMVYEYKKELQMALGQYRAALTVYPDHPDIADKLRTSGSRRRN